MAAASGRQKGARTMLRQREARAERIASVGVKLAKRRVHSIVANARGAQQALQGVLQVMKAAEEEGKTFSTRAAINDAAQQAGVRQSVARFEVDQTDKRKQAGKKADRERRKSTARGSMLEGIEGQLAVSIRPLEPTTTGPSVA